jgi:phosphoribosylanthranilate isomerase
VRGATAPLVKICGLTDPGEALACASFGAWAVGVVLSPGSPRTLAPADAATVLRELPPSVARVGVFVAPSAAEVAAAAAICGLTHIQLHGEVDVVAVHRATGLPVIEGIRVDGPAALELARASAADLVLLDAAVPGRHGGTGLAFDWAILEREPLERPFALAGGLTAESVGEAVTRLGPSVVDVSSGVERAPGRKDPRLVKRFIAAAIAAARNAT